MLFYNDTLRCFRGVLVMSVATAEAECKVRYL